MADQHVAIIGGGVTGALTAVRLATLGWKVTVLEKAEIGNGSSNRSAASIRAQFTERESVLGMMYSKWFYANFHELLDSETDAQPVMRSNGYLFLYEDANAISRSWDQRAIRTADVAWASAQRSAQMQAELGLDVRILTPQQISQSWPHLDASFLVGATWCESDGFLEAQSIYRRGFERATELGAQVSTGATVVGARLRGGRISALDTTKGWVEADWYVNATNAWSARLSPLIGGCALPVAPTKRYLYMLRPSPQREDVIGWESLPMTIFGGGSDRGAIARPVFGRNDGARLQAAWAHETSSEPNFRDEDQDRIDEPFDHRTAGLNYGKLVLGQIAEFAPLITQGMHVVETLSGYYGVTPDHTPIIGIDPHQSNLVHAVGFSGHGLMHAPFSAALVEGLVSGRIHDGTMVLPHPFANVTVNLSRFAVERSFEDAERLVL